MCDYVFLLELWLETVQEKKNLAMVTAVGIMVPAVQRSVKGFRKLGINRCEIPKSEKN